MGSPQAVLGVSSSRKCQGLLAALPSTPGRAVRGEGVATDPAARAGGGIAGSQSPAPWVRRSQPSLHLQGERRRPWGLSAGPGSTATGGHPGRSPSSPALPREHRGCSPSGNGTAFTCCHLIKNPLEFAHDLIQAGDVHMWGTGSEEFGKLLRRAT
uniref:Uncharacterized protein n=1 Tax=Pipistrellus kuhlii TaxID=59472 RepID=A0A7J7T0F9_PIPKU|nr:hypothetical protein mPipKuh1_009749 [Pipistrellus kuhlii]